MIGIYKITNLINNKIYIGQSTHIKTRWKSHQNDYNNSNSSGYNTMLYNAMRKYGIENFKFEILEECNLEELNNKECYWIKYYNTYIGFENCNGYNMTLGGNYSSPHSLLTYNQVEEIKNLLMNSSISQTELGEQYGVSSMTISDINRGIIWVDDSLNYPLRKINIRKGRLEKINITKEELYDLLIQNQGNFSLTGRQLGVNRHTISRWCINFGIPSKSSDYKTPTKIRKNKDNGNYTNKNKPVCMLDKNTNQVIKRFDSLVEASYFLNKPAAASHISSVCYGNAKTAYGYKWTWDIEERNK